MTTKILVVDDEPDLEMLIEQKFRKKIQNRELEFVYALNGEEALTKFDHDEKIEIVVTDINMPKMDGLELLSRLSESTRTLKCVIVSPYGDMDSLRSAMNKGAFDFVTRPINLEDLESTITKAIVNLQATKEAKMNQVRLSDIDKEIDVAKNIQSSIIPHTFNPFPNNTNFELLGTMLPARKIGGDFFDFFPLPDGHLGFCIADVSGKGIPAALFMTMSRGLIRSLGQKTTSPCECLKQLNELLSLENASCMFVTAFYGILNINTGVITYSNAGHNPPYIIYSDGTYKQIGRGEGIALGVTVEMSLYSEHTLQLKKNDIFLLYTDGVTEAMNVQKELFNEERLEKIITTFYNKPLSSLIDGVVTAVDKFSKNVEQTDDITLLAIKYKA
jgi:sigma-B regulation protein RsbU (phosphoserine phosphatase)